MWLFDYTPWYMESSYLAYLVSVSFPMDPLSAWVQGKFPVSSFDIAVKHLEWQYLDLPSVLTFVPLQQ